MFKKKLFFGWSNLKWVAKELVAMYSSETSYFSKKRIESGIGFIIAEWGMIFFLIKKCDVMTTTDFGIWAAIQFFVAGYIINQIQKEKSEILEHDSEIIRNQDQTDL